MHRFRNSFAPLALILVAAVSLGLNACDSSDDSDTTSVGNTFARISIDGPHSVRVDSTGVIDVKSQNIGLHGLRDSKVILRFTPELAVEHVDGGSGTRFEIHPQSNGNTEVVIFLGTLDASSQTISHVRVRGVLPAGVSSRNANVLGILTGQEFDSGDEAHADFNLEVVR